MPWVGAYIAGWIATGLAAAGVTFTIAGGTMFITVVGNVINAALLIGSSALAAKMAMPSASDLASQMDTGVSAVPYKKLVYGRTRVGGDMVFSTTSRRYWQNGGSLKAGDKEDQLMHMVIEVAGHEIESFTNPASTSDTQVYIGDELLTLVAVSKTSMVDLYPGDSATDTNGHTRYVVSNDNYTPGNKGIRESRLMFKFYKGDEGYADADLMDAMAYSNDSWDSTKIGDGRAYVVMRAYFDPATFQGMPKFTFYVKGKNDIYDPRGATSTGYSTNPALIMADYLSMTRKEGGIGEAYAEIDDTVLQASANICDESVTILEDSTTQTRYTLSGQFSTSDSPASVMREILNTMAGWMERVNGSWHINAGAYSAPAMTLTDSEMRDHLETNIGKGYKNTFNSVRPVLRAPETEWQAGNAKSVSALQRINISALSASLEKFLQTAHGLVDGDRIQVHYWLSGAINDSYLPSGLSGSAWYYVINAAADEFQVSLTEGGSAVAFGTYSGGGSVFVYYDAYLTEDTERKTQDIVFTLVADQTQARRLALIALLQTRMGVTASPRCKLGTPYACPFDLKVGDSVRWIDAHKGFWEYVGATETKTWQSTTGQINFTAHGYLDGQPIVITDNGTTTEAEESPLYATDVTTDSFYLARYRGGPAIVPSATSSINFRTIQGKLFRVMGWKHVVGSDGIPGVDIDLGDTNPDIYTWQSGYEVAPETQASITVSNPAFVEAPTGLTAASGTSILYTRLDGTIGSRVKLTWDSPTGAYVDSGKVEIEHRPAFSKTFTVTEATDDINCTAHGLAVDDLVQFSTTGTLPGGLDAAEYYFVYSVTTDSFKIAEYKGASSQIDITAAAGSGTHSVLAPDFNWTMVADIPASVTETYLLDLNDGSFYDFRIRFRSSMNQPGAWLTIYNHEFLGKSVPPAAPTSPAATTTLDDRIRVTWVDSTDLDLESVNVYRDDGAGGSFSKLDNVPRGIQKYDDFDADANRTASGYKYKLKSVDTSRNESTSFTSEVTGNTPAISAPTSITWAAHNRFNAGFNWTNPPISDLSHINLLWSTGMFGAMYASGTDKITTYSWDQITLSWTATAHGFSNGDIVYLDRRHWDTSLSPSRWAEDAAWDSGLDENSPYYVVGAGTNDFQISLTSGGSAIDITDITSSSDPWFSVIKYATPTEISKSAPKATSMGFAFEVPNDVAWFWIEAEDTAGNTSEIVSVGIAHPQFTNVSNAPNWSAVSSAGQQLTAWFNDGGEPRSFYTEDHISGDNKMTYTVDGDAFSTSQYQSIVGSYVIFIRNSTAPSVPTGTGIPAGWSLTPPSGSARLWTVQGDASATPNAYASPVLEVVNSKGETPSW